MTMQRPGDARTTRAVAAAAVLVLLAAASAVALWHHDAPPPDASTRQDAPSPSELAAMLAEDDGFARVRHRRALRFPADHGAHPAHRTEWWYVSGVLDTGQGDPAGFQVALTRVGLTARPEPRPSRWAASTVYFGFLTLSAPDRAAPLSRQRVARGALGLAGSESRPARVWIETWRLERTGPDVGTRAWRLHVRADDLELALDLRRRKPVIDAAELAVPGSGRRLPFRFYLQPRMDATGMLRIDDARERVSGTVSLEHAWGELPLPGGPVARDRFALYLDDGRELFCVRTHRVDGSGPATAGCLLVGRKGRKVLLSGDDIELSPAGDRVSGRSGARYPVRWTLRIPDRDIELTMVPHSDDGEVVVWAPVWAGPLEVRGALREATLSGRGFMHLSGDRGARARR